MQPRHLRPLAGLTLALGVSLVAIGGPVAGALPVPDPAAHTVATEPAAEPTQAQEPTPGQQPPAPLFPEDTAPAPDVSDVNVTGEAYTVRQDLSAPDDLQAGRYPRATIDATRAAAVGLGSFSDPGPAGSEPGTPDPATATCTYPESETSGTESAQGDGVGPSALARCFPGAAQGAGFLGRDPGPSATAGFEILRAGTAVATVDGTSNAAGATATQSYSALADVSVFQTVTVKQLTNTVRVRTNGRPGGATVETLATISGLSVLERPVDLPSDSLEQAAAVLGALAPILTPAGTVTFDVAPPTATASPDGTEGAGQAAQLLVTLTSGEHTTTIGLGFASARGRTVVTGSTPGRLVTGIGPGLRPSPFGPSPPLRPAAGASSRSGTVSSFGPLGANTRAIPTRPAPRQLPSAAPLNRPGGPSTAGINLLPPTPAPGSVRNAGEIAQYGGDGPWLALIGASLIGLALARYLAYSMAMRPTGP